MFTSQCPAIPIPILERKFHKEKYLAYTIHCPGGQIHFIPIINENDTGKPTRWDPVWDNDKLAALNAALNEGWSVDHSDKYRCIQQKNHLPQGSKNHSFGQRIWPICKMR